MSNENTASVIEKIEQADKLKKELIEPLNLYANGWTINGGGKEEQLFIDSTLDRINEINNSL